MAPSAPPLTGHASAHSRVQLACQGCRERRKRCDGGSPCSSCARCQRICLYVPVTHEENQAVRQRKGLDPTYPRTGSPCSLAQPPLATPQDAADVLALNFDSLAPPMEASGPLSCPLPTAATGFFDDALGSAAFQATQPAKPYLFLNATFNTYEEIGKAVVAQYEVVFAPTGDAVLGSVTRGPALAYTTPQAQ